MYQKLQTGRATAMAELLSDTIDNVNLNNVAVSSTATPGSGGTVLVDTSLDTGAELVTNGDFSATGSELVVDGDFTATGSELVVDGDFSSATDWNVNSNWNINTALGVAEADGTSDADINQNVWLPVIGTSYKVTFEVVSRSQGEVLFKLGGVNGQAHTTTGIKTEYIVATSADRLKIDSQSSFIGSVKDVSVKELGEDWNLEAGWSIEEDKATVNTVAATVLLSQSSLSVVAGKSYKISLEVSNIAAGSELQIEFSAGNIVGSVTTNGEFTFYGEWGASSILYLYALGTSNFSVSNVTLKELGEGWNLNNPPFSVVSNGIASDGTSTADANQVLFPTIGKKYKIVYTIDSISSGGYKIGFGGVVSSFDTTAGTYIRYITAIDDSGYDARLRITPDNSTVGTISYVSVEEFENAGFIPIGVKVGDIVYNTASIPNVATVVGISPDGDTLTLSNDISVTSGVPYKILSRTNSAATLYIGTVGVSATLKVRTAGGDDVTLDNLVQGTTLPTQVVRVYNTGTANVSNIIALF